MGPHMAVTDKELLGKYILRLYFMSARYLNSGIRVQKCRTLAVAARFCQFLGCSVADQCQSH